ncbi:hypothetical protein NDU88_005957 [Pleurodeles waltl]|uniref:Uncharacterized protein n=1 Tax=Pleurodeles waltl TaxID=8319 RepID=A0AAV7WCJ1_PLEWA|nr:hypothetical protein NDU88_005957 [Pleurodeles waltl]
MVTSGEQSCSAGEHHCGGIQPCSRQSRVVSSEQGRSTGRTSVAVPIPPKAAPMSERGAGLECCNARNFKEVSVECLDPKIHSPMSLARIPPKPKLGLGMTPKTRHPIKEGLARMALGAASSEESISGVTMPPFTLDIKYLILEGNKAIREKIDRMAIPVVLLLQDIDKRREPVNDLGTRADRADETLGAHTSQLVDNDSHLKIQETKLPDLEYRSRHILVQPEGT